MNKMVQGCETFVIKGFIMHSCNRIFIVDLDIHPYRGWLLLTV